MRTNSSRFAVLSLAAAGVLVMLLFYSAGSNFEAVSMLDNGRVMTELDNETHQLKQENTKLAAELQKYQFQSTISNSSNLTASSPCEVIHVCIVCAGYNAARVLPTVIKSLLFYRTNTLHFHFIVDSVSHPILKTLFETWAIPSVLYSFYPTSRILDDVSWVPTSHYSGVFGMTKLQLPYVLPPSVDKVILLDTDIVFSADIVELWRFFPMFQIHQMLGLVENLSDWYLPTRKIRSWPAFGRGYNTGIMLMDLDKMRKNNWGKLWRQSVNKYLPEYKRTKLADQDVINGMIKDSDGLLVHTLSCVWNVQLSTFSTFDSSCYSTAAAKVLHFNSQYKHKIYFGSPHKDSIADSFKYAYYMFAQYDGNLLKYKYLSADCGDVGINATSTRSVIGKLMDSNKKVSKACYQVEGLGQSSEGRMHLYYLPYSYTPKEEDITLVAQLGIDRLAVLEPLCENWVGPMSIALYLSDSQAQQFYEFVSNSEIINSRKNIGYHIIFSTGIHYPVNYLRNVALNNARTEYVFLTDIDFVPMANMYDHLRNFVMSHDMHGKKMALVLPAFETHQYQLKMPSNKEDLKKLVKNGEIQTFRADVWLAGHRATNYTRWYNSDQPYFISWRPNYEPYIVVNRDMVPRYDERFVGFGWNKVSHIMEVDAQGFKMMVLPDAFIIHSPHAPSSSISHFRSSAAYQKCVKTLKQAFQSDLYKTYGEKARKYLSS